MVVEDYSATSKDDAIGTVKANHLTIDVTGQKTEGLRIEGGVVDLGSDSAISANGTASTIYLTGRGYSEFNARNLTVTTAQSTALTLMSSMHAAVANIGEGSSIDGRNSTGHDQRYCGQHPLQRTDNHKFQRFRRAAKHYLRG